MAKQRFQQNGVEIKGAIFNAVERRSAGYYSYGYYEYKTPPIIFGAPPPPLPCFLPCETGED